jgi:hypothetical protein
MRTDSGTNRRLDTVGDDDGSDQFAVCQRSVGGSVALLLNNVATLPFFISIGEGIPHRKKGGVLEACAMGGV